MKWFRKKNNILKIHNLALHWGIRRRDLLAVSLFSFNTHMCMYRVHATFTHRTAHLFRGLQRGKRRFLSAFHLIWVALPLSHLFHPEFGREPPLGYQPPLPHLCCYRLPRSQEGIGETTDPSPHTFCLWSKPVIWPVPTHSQMRLLSTGPQVLLCSSGQAREYICLIFHRLVPIRLNW